MIHPVLIRDYSQLFAQGIYPESTFILRKSSGVRYLSGVRNLSCSHANCMCSSSWAIYAVLKKLYYESEKAFEVFPVIILEVDPANSIVTKIICNLYSKILVVHSIILSDYCLFLCQVEIVCIKSSYFIGKWKMPYFWQITSQYHFNQLTFKSPFLKPLYKTNFRNWNATKINCAGTCIYNQRRNKNILLP